MLSVLLLRGLYFDTRKAPQRTELLFVLFYNRCFMVAAERLRGSAASPGPSVQGRDGKIDRGAARGSSRGSEECCVSIAFSSPM